MQQATGQPSCIANVRVTTNPKYGDYQINGVMALAKKLNINPRKLAEDIVANLDISDMCHPPEIVGFAQINRK
jgi:arginyl-tRNA synthetase